MLSVQTPVYGQVQLAELDLSSARVQTADNGSVSYSAVPATLLAGDAVQLLAGRYPAGTLLDPLSFSVPIAAQQQPPGAEGNPSTPSADDVKPGTPDNPDAGGSPGSDNPDADTPESPGLGGATGVAPAPPAADKPAGNLLWGVRESFRNYLYGGIARGFAETDGELAKAVRYGSEKYQELYSFVQAGDSAWDPLTGKGAVNYAGTVKFKGHRGHSPENPDAYALNVSLVNPQIVSQDGVTALLQAATESGFLPIAELDLAAAKKTALASGAVTYSEVPAKLTADGAGKFFQGYYSAGQELDNLTFTAGAGEVAAAPAVTEPTIVPPPAVAPAPPAAAPSPAPVPQIPAGQSATEAGSFTWGISTPFVQYVGEGYVRGRTTLVNTGGRVTGSGVAGGIGGYIFPQSSSDFDFTTETGVIRYSGVVNFWAHHGLLNQSVSNPEIRVLSASTAELYINGAYWGRIDLSNARKTKSAGGAITWSGARYYPDGAARSFLASDYDRQQRIGYDSEISFTVGANGAPLRGAVSHAIAAERQAAMEQKNREALAKAAKAAKEQKQAKMQQQVSPGASAEKAGEAVAYAAKQGAAAKLSNTFWWVSAGVLVLIAAGMAVAAAKRLRA